jgi:outer membrane phospholipase A
MVKGPGPESIFAPGDSLKITWTAEPEEKYQIVIIDNKSNTIKEINAGPESFLAWKIDLKPGLYYWKFLGKDEMWKVGSLRVVRQ